MQEIKPIIIHFIYNLGRGGAETLLANTIKQLDKFQNIIITLEDFCEFEELNKNYLIINLNCPSSRNIPKAVIKFRKLILRYNPVLVHSHLPLPNIISRLATPVNIPLINTVHTTPSRSIAYNKRNFRFLEKKTFPFRKFLLIAVSQNVLWDYESFFRKKAKHAQVLYTCTDENEFKPNNHSIDPGILKIVTVGSLKESKNVGFILKALAKINSPQITLDIYGKGETPQEFEEVKSKKLPISLKGQCDRLNEILPNYDIFLSASKFEGFSVAVLESMASGLCLLLSDIPSFREQCADTAIYFSLVNTNQLETQLKELMNKREQIIQMRSRAHKRFFENYSSKIYLKNLLNLYSTEILFYENHKV